MPERKIGRERLVRVDWWEERRKGKEGNIEGNIEGRMKATTLNLIPFMKILWGKKWNLGQNELLPRGGKGIHETPRVRGARNPLSGKP